ncbi:hypothetical protein HC022_03810 [Salipiger sp. HF18]|uniref:hypothetical protein n=1 Tax=Salipiger sp. HF18 TaxID=2721557 RepID=UPI00142DA163|nr:hypothetical protein [Salipiger sp. HF18]NIY95404.1 hypothetical protein [Salipiger sp. HF18]
MLPLRPKRGQEAAAVEACLELRPDGTALLRSPFIEGGQVIFTATAQIVGEERDLAPESFSVEIAPAGGPFAIMGGDGLTGGSMSTRTGYRVMRRPGAAARTMLSRPQS